MPGPDGRESTWNQQGVPLREQPPVLPYLEAIGRSLTWEGVPVNLVHRRFHSPYDLGLLLGEVRRRRRFQVCYLASHGESRKLLGVGDKVIRLQTLSEFCRPSPR